MPYVCRKRDGKWLLTKSNSEHALGTHNSEASCKSQMRAIYASEMKKPENIRFDTYISMPYDLENKIENSGDEINLIINSEGGSFFDAIMIHNRLRNAGKPINVYVEAFAFSAAAIVMLAGDKIYMAENGLIFFHPPKISSYEMKGANDLEKIVETLRKSEEVLVQTLVSKTKKDEVECRKIMENDTWLTPMEALELGIVDEVVPILRENLEVKNYFPERIVNFVQEKRKMPMKEICERFGVDATAENAEEALVAYIQKLQPKKPTNLSESIVNMLKKARETELNILVTEGKVIPAVANELKLKYVTDERIIADVNNDSSGEFENIVNALSKNDPVLNFKSKSGTQRLGSDGKEIKESDEEANLLLKDMEGRS